MSPSSATAAVLGRARGEASGAPGRAAAAPYRLAGFYTQSKTSKKRSLPFAKLPSLFGIFQPSPLSPRYFSSFELSGCKQFLVALLQPH